MTLYVNLMSMSILFVYYVYLLIAISKVVTVPSLQLSAVVLPPILLQMVNEVALVQPLDPQ